MTDTERTEKTETEVKKEVWLIIYFL